MCTLQTIRSIILGTNVFNSYIRTLKKIVCVYRFFS